MSKYAVAILMFAFTILNSLFFIPNYVQATPTPLPQTGQTKCYNSSGTEITCAGTGQDGDIQAGVAWPNPRFTDNSDGTITDNLTGLQWSKNANPASGSNTYSGSMNWQQAFDYIKSLNNQSYLSHNDWRLPNRNELASLLNAEYSGQSNWLGTEGFYNIQQIYWSSSTGTNYTNW